MPTAVAPYLALVAAGQQDHSHAHNVIGRDLGELGRVRLCSDSGVGGSWQQAVGKKAGTLNRRAAALCRCGAAANTRGTSSGWQQAAGCSPATSKLMAHLEHKAVLSGRYRAHKHRVQHLGAHNVRGADEGERCGHEKGPPQASSAAADRPAAKVNMLHASFLLSTSLNASSSSSHLVVLLALCAAHVR